MGKFITFFVRWIGSNLAVPFWMVGHIHLSIHSFGSFIEGLSSLAMNLIVALGFILDYNNDRTTNTSEKN